MVYDIYDKLVNSIIRRCASTNTFTVFELISAYGGVGLSLGVPYVSPVYVVYVFL